MPQDLHLPPISDTEISNLTVIGAKVHNLKNVDITIPRNQLVVITGISGSGKSSLAFDTIYAEGQRRYMESFSAYARQFIGNMERPDVEYIGGLSPVISIEQKTTNKNPRSTVGTITEIYDFLRLLFARIGEAYSYKTGKLMQRFSEEQMMNYFFEHYFAQKVTILAPVVKGRKGHYRELFEMIRKQGFLKVRINGHIQEIEPRMQLDRYHIHDIEVIIDRIPITDEMKTRLLASLTLALKTGNGEILIMVQDTNEVRSFSKKLMCLDSGIAYEEPSPNSFSFNTPYGYCPECKGLGFLFNPDIDLIIPDRSKSINEGGIAPMGEKRDNFTFKAVIAITQKYGISLDSPIEKLPPPILNIILNGIKGMKLKIPITYGKERLYNLEFEGIINTVKRFHSDPSSSDSMRHWAEGFMHRQTCHVCEGTRLREESRWFKIAGLNIAEFASMDIATLYRQFQNLETELNQRQLAIAKDVLKEIRARLSFLLNVGLDYLSLDRTTRSLSGGESQRIRLATQIGSQLVGITYILDEPSIGLHQRDNQRLIGALRDLTQTGNTVLVVEHDKEIMLASDYLIDIGPSAGKHGGQIVGEGLPQVFEHLDTLTAQYLRGELKIEIPIQRRVGNGKFLTLTDCTGNNLKNVTLTIPLGTLTCVTGVSGSGKSSLINETLYPILNHHFYRAIKKPLPHGSVTGLEHIDKVIEIDQSPIGRTPRSNPATYIGMFTPIRDLFASIPESQIRGYKAGRFSFNVAGGRCDVCEGGGMKVIEMNFLPDVSVLCERCLGKRYNRETLEVRYRGKSISDVLDMTIEEAVTFFEAIPKIHRMTQTLLDVGLGYITLGQSATTLSGGEAQRVKLAAELQKRDTGNTLYILDEPTTGLHFEDIRVLMRVIQKLVSKGNSVIIIEHNLDVIKLADWVIDMGPEGGAGGGRLLYAGTPEEIAACPESHTGRFLVKELMS